MSRLIWKGKMSALSIRSMHRSQDLREQLLEEAWNIDKLKLDYGDAMAALKAADPQGWEKWYDDGNNVPDFQWKDTEKVKAAIDRIWEHVHSLAGTPG